MQSVCLYLVLIVLLRPPLTSQSSDEETIRALTIKYGQTIAAGNLDALREMWDQTSPNLAARLTAYRARLSGERIEFLSMNVTRVEVTGDKALSHLTSDERRRDKKTGAIVIKPDAYHGICRELAWTRTPAGWRVQSDVVVQDRLAAKLREIISDHDRDTFLEQEKLFITDFFVNSLIQSSDRFRLREDFESALKCIRLAQLVAQRIGDQAGMAATSLELGLVRIGQVDYEGALPPSQKALAQYEALGLRRGMAQASVLLSEVYSNLSDYELAFEYAQKALNLYEQEMNRGEGMIRALWVLGQVYVEQHNYQQGLVNSEKAMAMAEERGDKILIAMLRYQLASDNVGLGNYEKALQIYEQILEQIGRFADPVGSSYVRIGIGDVYFERGLYGEALDSYAEALKAFEAADYKRGIVQTLIPISNLYLSESRYAEALPLAERAVSLERQIGRPILLWWGLTCVGYAHLGLNHPVESRKVFEEAVSIIEKLREQIPGGVEERQRYFEKGLRAHHGMLGLLAKEGDTDGALTFAERTKGRVLLDVLQEGRVSIQKAMNEEEREQEQRLNSRLGAFNRQMAHIRQSDKPDPRRLRDLETQLDRARLDYEGFETILYAHHPELKIQRGQAPIVKPEELASLLPDANSALLEYVVTDEQSYLFAITKARNRAGLETHLYALPVRRAELTKQVERFRDELAERDLGFRASALRLGGLLLKPAQSQLRGKTNLIIVPDDRLWDLPFQALLTLPNRFLIEDSAISYAPSLTVLREMRKRTPQREANKEALLAIGNPVVGQETLKRVALRNESVAPLSEAEQEVKAIENLYGSSRSRVFIGPEASEARVKAEAGNARILHFATHGILNDAAPMYSYLVFAQGNQNEDGLLEARELIQLDLRADLVVLSACETARGRYGAGEGMIGLSWALFVAGVPATVVSQWKVEAASTRNLMVAFHRQLSAPGGPEVSKAEALRQAELQMLRRAGTNHPFYWAGFVLVGDGR
jgi:CHAT domain-containing protein/predicted negative regulator of RcsB-dependent stress response